MTNSNFEILFTEPAKKELHQLEKSTQRRITSALALLSHNPRPRTSRRVIAPEPLLRIRVGDYRIIYKVRDHELVILVISLGHRKNVYKKLN